MSTFQSSVNGLLFVAYAIADPQNDGLFALFLANESAANIPLLEHYISNGLREIDVRDGGGLSHQTRLDSWRSTASLLIRTEAFPTYCAGLASCEPFENVLVFEKNDSVVRILEMKTILTPN
ncbi:MAG: hypothetical protein H7145_10075 [Akkermansiaceae bacterium]|nr:hypothetical protein [Armatimonadota bacterium]